MEIVGTYFVDVVVGLRWRRSMGVAYGTSIPFYHKAKSQTGHYTND